MFPEFALTGYNFHSRDHILPYATAPDVGQSFKMAQEVSRLFNCYTVIGYPERFENGTKPLLYNSAAVTGPTGELVFNYRKSFLYYTDDDWGCKENPKGFQTFPLHLKQRATDKNGNLQDITLKTSIGICMDLSPYKFTAPFHDYEFATYNVDQGTELIICPMAWLHSSSVTKDEGKLSKRNYRRYEMPQRPRDFRSKAPKDNTNLISITQKRQCVPLETSQAPIAIWNSPICQTSNYSDFKILAILGTTTEGKLALESLTNTKIVHGGNIDQAMEI